MLSHGEMRIWTSIKGDTVEAEYISIMSGKVVLKRPDGKQLKVPASGLCVADRDYLASMIPPKIKIDVDVDKDRDTLTSYSSDYGSYNYERKAETTKCIVTLEKTNREECNRDFTAYLYVIGKDTTGDKRKVLSYVAHDFSFKNKPETEFRSVPTTTEYTKSDYATNRGYRFEGYLIYIEDENGTVVAIESSQSRYEKNLHKIKPARDNTEFDNDFDMLNPPSNTGSKKRKKRT
jgi:hypothetical protein